MRIAQHIPNLEILYEDNHVLAVVKPAGVLVQRDASGDISLIDIAKAYIKERYKKPGNVFVTAVHRIDRPASGIVLLAKTSKAASRLSKAFRDNRVKKAYLIVVEGNPASREEKLEGWILKKTERNISKMVSEGAAGAKRASLSYRVLGRFGDYSLLAVFSETGRSHQIRVQLSNAGFPVAGDKRYGAKSGFGNMIALHAASITFPHPTHDEEIALHASPPEVWSDLFGKKVVDLAQRFCRR